MLVRAGKYVNARYFDMIKVLPGVLVPSLRNEEGFRSLQDEAKLPSLRLPPFEAFEAL